MRLIARLDVKPPFVIKPIFFEGVRKVGVPEVLAEKYYADGADEIFYIDVVSSLYQRDIILDLVKKVSKEVFVPFGVGGGIKTLDDVKALMGNGADKVVVNTNAIHNPQLIEDIAKSFGSQALTVHIEAKRWNSHYECYTDCGRNRTDKDVLEWAKEAEDLGAGEIFLSLVDNDGAQKGFDLDVSHKVISNANVPVVIGSGAGCIDDIIEVAKLKSSGVAVASVLHYDKLKIKEIKEGLIRAAA